MRYKLNVNGDFSRDLAFWIGRYIHHKLTTLSNHRVLDKGEILACIHALHSHSLSIQAIKTICKKARNAGLIGIATYANPLFKLYEYLTQTHFSNTLKTLENIDEEMMSDFLSIETSALSNASKKNYRIAIIGFFGYIDRQNEENGKSYVFNITLKINALRGLSGQKLPAFLSESELERFLKSIDEAPLSPAVATRDKLIIKFIVYTGIRISEALHLRHKDILPMQDCYALQIRGKGNKPRVVMIKAIHVNDKLSIWLKERSSYEPQNDLLFCNARGKALSQSYLYRQIESILLHAGIRKEKNGAHMLRHSFATLLYQKKHDLIMVQEALGHANLNTSRIYTHFDKARLQEAATIMDHFNQD